MTPELDIALTALRVEFAAEITSGQIVHLGFSNCRRKNNQKTGPWSEHSWENAVDVMLKAGHDHKALDKPLGDRIAKWMRSHPELWSEVFWQIASHFDHVHGTANPRRNPDNKRIPPCAGGPVEPEPSPSLGATLLTLMTDDTEQEEDDMWQYLTANEDLVQHAWNQGWLKPKTEATLEFFVAAVRSGDINEPTWPDFKNFRVAVTNGIALSAGRIGLDDTLL